MLRPPERSLEELEAAPRGASGQERRIAFLTAAVGHLLAAEAAEDRRAERRHRTKVTRFTGYAARKNRDGTLRYQIDFVNLWNAWRGGRPSAERLAERFTEKRRESGHLLYLAWIIRAEIEAERKRWSKAATAYRYVLGAIDHPLYGFALLRTADLLGEQDRRDERRQALEDVVRLACDEGADPAIVKVASVAAGKLRVDLRAWPDGTRRPSTCEVPKLPEN